MTTEPLKVHRSDNRLPAVLDAAARLFAEKGYSATSMRDIAMACGMLPGSLYYHFAAKEDLLTAVYKRGVQALRTSVREAVARETKPWEKLEAACSAHLETVLRRNGDAQVLIRVLPKDIPAVAAQLHRLRDSYEREFELLVAALPLPASTDRKSLRLMLLGALNWARFWFDPDGRDTPRSLARKFVNLLKDKQHG